MGSFQMRLIDRNGEKPSVEFPIADLSGDITAEITALNAFIPVLLAITTLNQVSNRTIAFENDAAGTKPTDVWAQKEIKWVIHFHDSVNGRAYTRTVPGADLTLLQADSDRMNIASGAGATFVASFESLVVSRDGNPVVVDYIELQDN